MTAQVFIALFIAFLGGLLPGSALLLYALWLRLKLSEGFRQGFIAGLRILPPGMFFHCPACGSCLHEGDDHAP
jgi:hypothetical protein